MANKTNKKGGNSLGAISSVTKAVKAVKKVSNPQPKASVKKVVNTKELPKPKYTLVKPKYTTDSFKLGLSNKALKNNKVAFEKLKSANSLTKSQKPIIKKPNKPLGLSSHLPEKKKVQPNMTGEEFNSKMGALRVGLTGKATLPIIGQQTKDFTPNVNNIMSGKYSKYMTEEEANAWAKENFKTIRYFDPRTNTYKKQSILKKNATMPVSSYYQRAGGTVSPEDIEAWKNYVFVNSVQVASLKQYTPKNKKDVSKVANYSDYAMSTNNSFADIGRSFLNDVTNAKKDDEPLKNLTVNFKNYIKDYYINPLLHKDANGGWDPQWAVIGLNTLNNLGETLDVPGTVMRSLGQHRSYVYGSKNGVFEGQKAWVYSGGKEKQKKLTKLGAQLLINNHDYTWKEIKDSNKLLIEKFKKEGMLDELKKFYKEYQAFNKTYSSKEAVKDALTTHHNYSADIKTGNSVLDTVLNLGTEIVMDPSIIVGGFASKTAKSGVKVFGEASFKAGLEAVVKNPKELAKLIEASKQTQKQFVKHVGKDIHKIDTTKIGSYADATAKQLVNNGIIEERLAPVFAQTVTKSLKDFTDSKSWNIIRSAKYTDTAINKIDTALLKAVFAAPYLTYKIPYTFYKQLRKTKKVKGILFKKAFKEKAAMTRVLNKVYEKYGDVSITDFEEYVLNLASEDMVAKDSTFVKKSFNTFVEKAKKDSLKLDSLKYKIYSGKAPVEAVDDLLDGLILEITHGGAKTKDEFAEYLDSLMKNYANKFDEDLPSVIRIYENHIAQIEEASKVQATTIKNNIFKSYKDFITSDSPDLNVLRTIYDDSLSNRKYLPRVFVNDLDKLVKNYNEQDAKLLLKKCEYKYATAMYRKSVSATDLINKSKSPIKNSDVKFKAVDEHSEVVKIVNDYYYELLNNAHYKTNVLDKESKVKIKFKKFNYFLKVLKDVKWNINKRSYDTIDTQELYNAALNAERELIFRNIYDESFNNKALLKIIKDFNLRLLDSEMSIVVKSDTEIHQLKTDRLRLFEEFVSDGNLHSIIDELLEPNSKLNEAYELALKNESDEVFKDSLINLKKSAQVVREYNYFQNKLLSRLSQEEAYAVLDVMFGLTKGKPQTYSVVTSKGIERLLNTVDLNLASRLSNQKVSLDGFRQQAVDFNNPIYDKYRNEINDPEIQKTIERICSGGHEDPLDDVKVQMLMVFLKDPDSIEYYNTLSKNRDVFFTDIETHGLNSSLKEISSIATLKWDNNLSNNPTLKELLNSLDVADNNIRVGKYQTYHTKAELDKLVTDDIIQISYKNNPRLRGDRVRCREQYYKRFSSEDNLNKVISEKDMLEKFLYDIETTASKTDVEPVLVTHNNNGFDMNYIYSRCLNNSVTTTQVKTLDSLRDSSINTLEQLKKIEGCAILTQEDKDFLTTEITNYFRQVNRIGVDNMKYLDLSQIMEGLRLLDFPELKPKIKALYDLIHSTTKQRKMFESNYFVNDFKRDIRYFDDDDFTKWYAPEDIPVIKKALVDCNDKIINKYKDLYLNGLAKKYNLPESEINNYLKVVCGLHETDSISRFSSKKFFTMTDTNKFFDIKPGVKYSYEVLSNMQHFSKDVQNLLDNKLKDISIIESHIPEFKVFITECLKYATKLSDTEPKAYLKYLNVPDNDALTFLVARKLWKELFSVSQNPKVDAVLRDEMTPLQLPPNLRNAYLIFNELKSVFYGNSLDHEAFVNILHYGKLDEHIFKGLVPEKYLDQFQTSNVIKAEKYRSMILKLNYKRYTYDTYSLLNETYTVADNQSLEVHQMYQKFIEVLNRLEALPIEDIDELIVPYAKAVREYKQAMKSMQILEKLSESEDNLIAHLLHNGQAITISRRGSKEYIELLETFLEKFSKYNLEHVVVVEKDDFIHIMIDKTSRFETYKNQETKKDHYRFIGESKEYIVPDYKPIDCTKFNEIYLEQEKLIGDISDKIALKDLPFFVKFTEDLKSLGDQLDNLTNGSFNTSGGRLHTYGRHVNYIKSLPPEVTSKGLTSSVTCDRSQWHTGSFDMNIIGEEAECWKINEYEYDADAFVDTFKTFEELSHRKTSLEVMKNSLFGENSLLRFENLFMGVPYKEVLEALKKMPDQVMCFLREGKTETGVEVVKLNIVDKASLTTASNSGAILLPYDVYTQLLEMFNEGKIDNKFLKLWAKGISYIKLSQIASIGTATRNILDATIKTVASTGSVPSTFTNQLKAMRMLNEYQRISSWYTKNRNPNVIIKEDLKRGFEAYKKTTSKPSTLTWEQYNFIDDWLKSSLSGGDSAATSKIKEYYKIVEKKRLALKAHSLDPSGERKLIKDLWHTVGTDDIQWESLPYNDVRQFVFSVDHSVFREYDFTMESYLDAFVKQGENLDDVMYIKYYDLTRKLIDIKVANTKAPFHLNYFADNVMSKAVLLMSKSEEVIRLGQYMALEEQGLTRSEIFKEITDTQFNYDTKSLRTKYIEMAVPFWTYQYANFMYWCKAISINPRMLQYLEAFGSELLWNDDDYSIENYASVEAYAEAVLKGNLKLGDTGTNLKLNPSFLDAFNMFYGGTDNLFSKISSPLQLLVRAGTDHIGVDAEKIIGRSGYYYDTAKENALSMIPVFGTMYNKYKTYKQAPWLYLSEEEAAPLRFLAQYVPSLIGTRTWYIDNYNSLTEFREHLRKHGKWYDAELNKIVDISEENNRGRNALYDNNDWKTLASLRLLYKGELWDNNQRKFVKAGDFIIGGLNQKFDFKNNPKDWELYQKYRKKYLGEVWDNNQSKFVREMFFVPGGLNTPNISWRELSIFKYALYGERWINGKWVKVTDPMVITTEVGSQLGKVIASNQKKDKPGLLEKLLSQYGIVELAYGKSNLNSSVNKLYKRDNKYILTGDSKNDSEIFEILLKTVKLDERASNSYRNYHYYTKYKPYKYKAKEYPVKVQKPSVFNNAQASHLGIKSGSRVYSKPVSSGNDVSGLRMATSRYKSYDQYYGYNYNYLYRYRYGFMIGNYPESKIGIQRYPGNGTGRQYYDRS